MFRGVASIRKINFSEHTARSIRQPHNESVVFFDRLLLFSFETPCGRFLGFRANPRVCWKDIHSNIYIYIYICLNTVLFTNCVENDI